jgi:hypothetical protein
MGKKAGLWIDGKKAVVVFVEGKKLEKSLIPSNIDHHPGRVVGPRSRPNVGSRDFPAKDHEERYYEKQVLLYLDQVVSAVRSCEELFVFGPGEVHVALVDRLNRRGFRGRIVGVESADRMTDPQVVAKVRGRFA